MEFKKYIRYYMKNKDYKGLSHFIVGNAHAIGTQIKITKKIQQHITVDNLVEISRKCKESLKYFDFKDNIKSLMVDLLLDGKISGEYQRPSYNELQSIYWALSHEGVLGIYFMVIIRHFGYTFDDFAKFYKKGYHRNMQNMLSFIKRNGFKISDNELRKTFQRSTKVGYLDLVNHLNEKEIETIKGNKDSYDYDLFVVRNMNRVPEKTLMQYFVKQCSRRGSPTAVIPKLKSYDTYTIYKTFNNYWPYVSPQNKVDENLATILSLAETNEQKLELITKYYNL